MYMLCVSIVAVHLVHNHTTTQQSRPTISHNWLSMLIINWLPCCWSYGCNLVIKQFIRTHNSVYALHWKGCCRLCLTIKMSLIAFMHDVASGLWLVRLHTMAESHVHLRTMASCRWKPGALVHEVVYVWQCWCSSCTSKFAGVWLGVASMFDT